MVLVPLRWLVVWCALMSTSLPRPLELRFTRSFYNVTIPENSVSRTLVTCSHRMGVFKHSGDEDVTFRILSGDPDRIFKAEDKEVGDFIFLVLRTRGGNSVVLNRERKDKFVLTVKAFSTRSTIEASTIIYVRVLDQNDLSPIFVPSEYNRTIPEDFSLYRPILKVSAEDADLGVSGEIFYSIRESSGYFSIHPFTGEVTITKRLKYSERSIHDLMIVAQDRATIFKGGGHVTLAKATVRVRQVNLYGPEIYVYVLQDPSAHKLGLVYAVVRVVDRDEGIHGQIGDISIVSGDNNDSFLINPVDENKNNTRTEYNIILANGVTFDQSFIIYNLSLRVSDDGFPQRISYKTVSILVQYESEKEPYFENESQKIDVPEYLPQGSPILRINIQNSNLVLPNDIELRIIEGNEGNMFFISSKNFILYTNSQLDADSSPSYSLTVKLLYKDREILRHPSVTKIKINVQDFNDNNPKLNDFPDEIWVNENQPAGTHVVKILASDSDSGKNGFLTFSIVNNQFVPFEIDPLSGIVRTTQPLDFETMKRDYLLTVRVSDSGQPFRRQTQSQLNVQIRNLNDNSPVFLKGDCSVSIPTRLNKESHLLTVTALDLDEMDIITYSITSSYRNDCIKINPTNGKLTLECDLKEVLEKEWETNVTATDGLYKSKTSIKVFIASSDESDNSLQRVQYSCRDIDFYKNKLQPNIVIDEKEESNIFELPRLETSDNLHDPEILLDTHVFEISESQETNVPIYQVKALDKDNGYNGKLIFDLISSTHDSVFKIDPNNGTIFILAPLKPSEAESYILNVSVCDQGYKSLCSYDLLSLKVTQDTNSKIKFGQTKTIVHVKESLQVGKEIIRVFVDQPQFASYSVISGKEYFSIDSKNGSLFLSRSLNRESKDNLSAKIRAKLINDSNVFTDTTVTVIVDDENDNAPSFVNSEYTIHVREDIPTGSVIYIVNAVDYDTGKNGSIVYSLFDSDVFIIDGTSGVIRLNGRLDYESVREHRLVIQASDEGTPPLTSQVTLTVLVNDVNENLHPPVFDEVVVVATVKENSPPGSDVVTVTAIDADPPGDDSRVIYSIREGDGLGYFNITEQGSLITSVILDAEFKNNYWLTVIAEDCGSLPLSGSIQVYIQVEDVNDHLPLTLVPSYHFHVEENLPSHTAVGQVTASDGDLEAGSVKYTLAPHSAGLPLPFSIHSNTGFISTTSLLDRDEENEYLLKVVVSDGGSPELSSTTEVMVSVMDVNDNTPQFIQEHYSVRLPQLPVPLLQRFVDNEVEQVFPDGDKWLTSSLLVPDDVLPLAQVLAVDMDVGLNGTVSYSIQSGSPFLVHPETGQIYTRTRLMPGREYDVMVRASDNGNPSRSSTTRVTFHTLHKQHTLKPLSSLQQISVEIQENIKPGTNIIKLNASVHDKSQLHYVISGGNGTSHFAMQGDSLLAARRWNLESSNMFHLTVSASNHSFTWFTEIWVKLMNVNKYDPRFDQELYTLTVSEDTPVGSVLLTLHATDQDVNSTLTYHIHNSQSSSSDVLSLDSKPGDLVLTAPLDRETLTTHLLTVRVSDGGSRPRHGFTRVILHVTDANDNRPVWPANMLYFRVSEDTPVGAVIGRLVASDIDSGNNGTVKYRIISGNNVLRNTFSVQDDEGTLVLLAPLDAWFTPKFLLTVQARDLSDTQVLDSTVQVEISVVPSERKNPRCLEDIISLEVSEAVRVGEVVGHVSAYFMPSLQYQLQDSEERQDFLVNPSLGDIVVQHTLDFEAKALYNLTVTITNMAGKSTSCKVVVYVVDVNDNRPSFIHESYSGFIQESASPGSIVKTQQGPLRILAEDLDSGVNGVLEFTVQEGSGQDLLTVDPITGTVRTTKALDYETMTDIRVKVSVSDWGVPRLTSDYLAEIHVQILNINDCSPVFEQSVYNVSLTLPAEKDALLLQVNAEDLDGPDVTSLKYSLVLGNEDLALEIDEDSGEIFLQEPLKIHPRQLKVRVHDGVHEDSALVNIHTRQREPTAIRFQKPLYQGAVLENSTKVSIVTVVDVLGSKLDEVIRFSILSRSPQFSIGNTSGIITTNGYVFDREKIDFYRLNIKAYSFDRNIETFATVNITVLDANDNCPRFNNLPYRATITVNATKGDFVFKVNAKDMDIGENGEVRYELDQSSLEVFRIGRKSGEIRLKTLSIHNKYDINVIVTANDGGIVPCSTSTTLIVSVIDSRAPLWERTVYKSQLAESSAILSAVPVTLKAAAVNKVLYQLISSETFLLRHDTGALQVYDSLDRESVSSYSLTLRATDVVTRLHSDTLLLLEILDVNDCFPEFLQESYSAKIPEDAEVGTSLLQVSAVDRDTGMNAVIRYSVSHPLFTVNAEDGTLMLARHLDYEQSKLHHVTVTASDSGHPPLSSFVTVSLQVLNVNDHAPKFVNDLSTFKVSQNVKRNSMVGKIIAQDDDRNELTYNIVSKEWEIQTTFNVDKFTGIITISNPSLLVSKREFHMNISVDDGVHYTTGLLTIKVLPCNRHAPIFDLKQYGALIKENLPAGRTVIKVTASDKDDDRFGNITYTLPPQKGSAYFAVDKYTGVISTLRPLDRENVSQHMLDVMARDGGGLQGWTSVQVSVLDDNDNPPSFTLPKYMGCVPRNLTRDHQILRVFASDPDGDAAGRVRYSITRVQPQQAREWFHIHPQEGAIYAYPALVNQQGPQEVTLIVEATDEGVPPLSSEVSVKLSIMTSDQHPKLLRHFPSQFIIPSYVKPGYVIHKLEFLSSTKPEIHIIGGEDSVVVNSSGHLLLKRLPKFRRKSIGVFISSTKTQFSQCFFKTLDVVYQSSKVVFPEFTETKIHISIPEIVPLGYLVHKVTILNDMKVHFSILEDTDYFSIDPLTGWITVTGVLDRETTPNHEFSVLAAGKGFDQSKCSVIITLTDINDNPHIFNQEVYNVAVKENAPVGTLLTRLSLMDPDEDRDALSYFIIEGDDYGCFTVTQGLEVTLTSALDRETISNYVLTILASDGVFTATTTVNVVVIDVNDERHSCVYSTYVVSVSESHPPGHLVTSILTTDADLESPLEYQLSGVGAERFTIDNHGEIRLKQFIDREVFSSFTLEAKVLDSMHHNWFCTSRVRVTVEDINDNPPSFAIINETVTLTEDATVGMIVTKVQVLDFDQGKNQQVSFFQVGTNRMFNLSSSSGLLTLARPMQSTPGSVHSVTVGASDHGIPRLTSITTIQVIVVGMNDDPPAHVSGAFQVTISEDAPVGTALLHLRTLHNKETKKAQIIYTILEGNGQAEFEIDRNTGVLATAKPLDYEAHQGSHLLILATTVGDASLINYISVNVTVLDINDNPPVFKVTRYSVQIREDVEVGQMVLKVDVEDVDSGKNGVVKFSLDKNSARKFTVDSFTGVLMVANQLDREQCGEYTVLVIATDQGSPPLSSTATVSIDVTDVNDNPPSFLHPNSTAVLQADRMPGWAVFHFAVTDPDQASTSSHFTFQITEGNQKGMFRVDPDGTLRTTDKLAIKLLDFFQLTVQVDDGGSPNLFSSTWIYIKVVEPSKHPPVISPLRVWVGVYENQWQGGDIGHVTATDLDPYDKLEYSVPATPQFTVDPRLGTLKARGSLAPGAHSVNVSVTDGKFVSSCVVTVTVQSLSQDMLQTSVYIRMFTRVTHDILVRKLPLFLSTLHSAFLRDVTLVSVQDIPNSTIGMLIAVAGGADLHVVHEVMASAGLQGSTPQCDCRNGGVCQRQLQIMPDKTNVFSGAGLSFVTPGHSLSYYCICSIGYAGEHCEEIKCMCPPLQVCVPQRVGFSCMPPCSTNHSCPAAMTSSITWPEIVICVIIVVAIVLTIVVFIVYRRYKNSVTTQAKYGSWGKQNLYMQKKTKLSNIEASQKPPIFTGSPNNGTSNRNNLDTSPGAMVEGETIPLDYLRNINPIPSKIENDILQGHSSAPDLATCHSTDSFVPEDPARELAALDEQLSLSQDVVQYGFPPPSSATVLPSELEIPL